MTPLSASLRVALGIGMLVGLAGYFLVGPPLGLWLALIGWLAVLVVAAVAIVQIIRERRRD